jgi:hypothetical protein
MESKKKKDRGGQSWRVGDKQRQHAAIQGAVRLEKEAKEGKAREAKGRQGEAREGKRRQGKAMRGKGR